MDSEFMDDICCATCSHGEMVRDNDEGYMIRCRKNESFHPEDDCCCDYK